MNTVKFTITLLFLSVTQAFAQDAQPDNVSELGIERIAIIGSSSKFGATKSDIPIIETPRSVSIITSDDFIDLGSLSLANTVSYTAGVTGDAFGPSTRSNVFSIRGLDAPEYQDNLQVQFDFFNNARADIFTIEQVEVLKGPASVLYGQAAPGGIVSTVSKVARATKLGNEVVVTAGNNERFQGSIDLGFDLSGDGKWTARFVGVYRDSDTQVDFVNDDTIVLAPSITYETDNTTITGLINYTKSHSDTSNQFLPLTATACQSSNVTISDPSVCANAPSQQVDSSTYVGAANFNRFDTEAVTLSLFASHEFNDVWSFDGTMRYRDNDANYNQTWISFQGDGTPRLLPDGTAGARSFFGGPAGSDQFAFDARVRADFDTGAFKHALIAGLNYQDVNTFSDQAFVAVFPTAFNIFAPVYDGSDIPTDEEFDAVRVFTENNTKASDTYLIDHISVGNLVVNIGVRVSSVDSQDALSKQKDNENPFSIGALYKTSIDLNPYVSYAESFRSTVGTDVETNTSLKPRTGEQFEAGIKYQPQNSASYVTIAYFDLEEDNLVEFVAAGSTQPGLSITAEGIEIEGFLKLEDFAFDFDFRLLDANEIDATGVEKTRTSEPDTTASLWTTWEPKQGALNGIKLGAGIRYASENESNGSAFLATNNFTATPIKVETDGYTVFDLFVAYAFSDNLKGTLNVRNLTDKEYYSTCLSRGDCFPGEERTIVGNVSYQF